MDRILMHLIGVFFLVGGIDYIFGSRFKLGVKFEEGIKTMGALGLGMIGIYSLAPVLSGLLSPIIIPIFSWLHFDPSIFPASFLATDMGGLQMAAKLAVDKEIGILSGISIASTLGTTICFSIPVAIRMIPVEDQSYFSKGIMVGVMAIPIGCLAAGLWLRINLYVLLWNILPILIFSAALGLGLLKAPAVFIKGFDKLGKVIISLSIIGLLLQGMDSMLGVKLVSGLEPLSEAVVIVGKTAFVLGGAFPMLAFLNMLFKSFFEKIGNKLGINSVSVAGIIGSLASNLLIFGTYKDMDPRGKVISTAFSVNGSFLLGGQLGLISTVAPDMLPVFVITKLTAGVISMCLGLWLLRYEKRDINLRQMQHLSKETY